MGHYLKLTISQEANSPGGTMEFTRQLDILNPDSILFPITMIGVGGIGSPCALALSKMGCNKLTIYDGDWVENHNLPNQIFRKSDIDRQKVEACSDMVNDFSDCQIMAIKEYYRDQPLSGVVISGVDKMKARKDIWSQIRYNVDVPLYIDGRIGGEIVQVYTIKPYRPEDVEFYEKWLFSDKEVAPLPCTARAIIYIGFMAGALIASQLKKWLNKEKYYRRISFDLKTMTQVLQ